MRKDGSMMSHYSTQLFLIYVNAYMYSHFVFAMSQCLFDGWNWKKRKWSVQEDVVKNVYGTLEAECGRCRNEVSV